MKNIQSVLVRDIMTSDVVSVKLSDSSETVSKLFDQLNIHHIPVMFENNVLAGLVSKTDIFKVHSGFKLVNSVNSNIKEKEMLTSILAEDIMTRYLVNLTPTDTLENAIHIFLKNRFHAMPVLENGVLVGILSTYDILWWMYNNKQEIHPKDFGKAGNETSF